MHKSNIIGVLFLVFSMLASMVTASQDSERDPIDLAKAISITFEKVAEKISPSLVTIQSKKEVQVKRGDSFRPRDINLGLGSGLIITQDGHIVTNAHVVDQADDVAVSLSDGTTIVAEIIGADPKTDIALLKVNQKDFVPASLGDSDQLRVGQFVIAAGNPFGLSASITSGIVSAIGRSNVGITDYENFIQTDASINQGNSGGPLVNLDGDVIGINTAMLGRNGNIGIGFAIPINLVKDIVNDLTDDGEVTRGFLGVRISELNNNFSNDLKIKYGIFVSTVYKDSPASSAGIQPRDVITHLNGIPAKELSKFRFDVASFLPGEEVILTILREGSRMDIKVELGSL
ncbi:MAG TPA: serine protease [Opitutae bacterium]|nr:serine protease [Opitutae bacterium]